MTTCIALLRGVNVGGRRRLPMGQLRVLLAGLGYPDATTYLQSGNAVFDCAGDLAEVAGRISQRLAEDLGLDVAVLVRSRDELARVVDANPFKQAAAAAPVTVHVAFLSAAPAPDGLAGLDPAVFAPDEFRAGDRVVYLRYPNGSGRSKLTNDVVERRLGVRATTRNWNTVTRLLALACVAERAPRGG